MKEHFLSLANYNAWANDRLYEAVAHLPDEEISRERDAAFFTSILGTLNHILLADRVWLDRLEDQPLRYWKPDTIIESDLEALQAARRIEDRRILAFCDALGETGLKNDVAYSTMAGDRLATRLDRVLTHLFNHQTHHRGQAHALILEAGAEPPPLDYIYYLRSFG